MYADIDGKIQPYSKRYFIYSLGPRPIGIQVESLTNSYRVGSGSYFPIYGTHLCFYNEMTNEYIEEYITAAMEEEVREELEN